MVERSSRTRFDGEPFAGFGLRTQARVQELHRDGTVQAGVPAVTDLGHSPEPEDVAEFVSAAQQAGTVHGREASPVDPCVNVATRADPTGSDENVNAVPSFLAIPNEHR